MGIGGKDEGRDPSLDLCGIKETNGGDMGWEGWDSPKEGFSTRDLQGRVKLQRKKIANDYIIYEIKLIYFYTL